MFRAVHEALRGLPLWEASRAIAEERVVDTATGQPFAWRPMPMVLPVTDRLRALVEGEDYERQVAEEAAHHAFRVIGGARLPPLL